MSFRAGGEDLWIRRGKVVGVTETAEQDVLILGGRVQQLGRKVHAPPGTPELDARGKLVFPGLIDTQVHFREPGLEHKEDLESGGVAAVCGGITAFCEMPNTSPPTTDPAALVDKLRRASGRVRADHAFFLGACPENAEQLGDWENLPGCAGIKIFMGSSTGTLLVPDDRTLERVLRSGRRRCAVHSEDEPRLRERYARLRGDETVADHPAVRDVESAVRATTRLLDLVERTGRRVHLLHVSTAEELELVRRRGLGELVTMEATPNHLFLHAPDCYQQHGARAQMNPPVRDQRHRDALREAVAVGLVACIGSDHAPHTAAEKDQPFPRSPSGIPGVQTTLPLLLTAVRDGWLDHQDIVRLLCTGPVAVYGIEGKGPLEPGNDGDAVLVDPGVSGPLPEAWMRSRAGWNPFVGRELAGWPVATVVRGRVVQRDGEPTPAASGAPLRYAP